MKAGALSRRGSRKRRANSTSSLPGLLEGTGCRRVAGEQLEGRLKLAGRVGLALDCHGFLTFAHVELKFGNLLGLGSPGIVGNQVQCSLISLRRLQKLLLLLGGSGLLHQFLIFNLDVDSRWARLRY